MVGWVCHNYHLAFTDGWPFVGAIFFDFPALHYALRADLNLMREFGYSHFHEAHAALNGPEDFAALAVCAVLVLLGAAGVLWPLLGLLPATAPSTTIGFPMWKLERRNRSTAFLLRRAAACGQALRADRRYRGELVEQAKALDVAELVVRRAWKLTCVRLVAISPHERAELKSHAGRVVAALRAASNHINSDPDEGLRRLGELLVTVAERCAEGHVGALLDEEQLEGFDPVRDHELLRLVLTAGVVGAAAVGIALLRLPSTAAAPLTSAVDVIGIALIYRKAARRGLDTLSVLFGGR